MVKKLKKEFGKHYLVELMDCNPSKIKFVRDVKKIFLNAAKKSRATILESSFYQFRPYGVSGMIFIAESHFSIHTWPEEKYVGFDILTCGRMYPQRAIAEMQKKFEAKKIKIKIFPRGF